MVYGGEGVADGVRDNTARSRVWPACSCAAWNRAVRRLEVMQGVSDDGGFDSLQINTGRAR
jgi:hypothetical protein